MQDDGNLVVYDRNNKATWASNTVQKDIPDQHQGHQHEPSKLIAPDLLQEENLLISPNNYFFLKMQKDGNLVLYKTHEFTPNNALWSSKTNNQSQGPYNLRMQEDGNLVIYDRNNKPLWASETYHKGNPPFHLKMQEDGNLCIYDQNNTATWSS